MTSFWKNKKIQGREQWSFRGENKAIGWSTAEKKNVLKHPEWNIAFCY